MGFGVKAVPTISRGLLGLIASIGSLSCSASPLSEFGIILIKNSVPAIQLTSRLSGLFTFFGTLFRGCFFSASFPSRSFFSSAATGGSGEAPNGGSRDSRRGDHCLHGWGRARGLIIVGIQCGERIRRRGTDRAQSASGGRRGGRSAVQNKNALLALHKLRRLAPHHIAAAGEIDHHLLLFGAFVNVGNIDHGLLPKRFVLADSRRRRRCS